MGENVGENEAYYIKCCRRSLKINGYICVGEDDKNGYITSWFRKIEPDKNMLFQLQRYKKGNTDAVNT